MKNVFSLSAVGLFVLMIVLTSCGSSRTTTSKRYPYPGSTYPYPDNRYPQGYPYPNDRYPDYGRYPNNYPPGQAKKIYRSKSAKVYAPGQRKKYDRYDGKYNKKRNRKFDDRRRR